MTAKRKAPARRGGRPDGATRTVARRTGEAPATRRVRRHGGTAPAPSRDPRTPRSGPQTTATARPDTRPAPPKNARQAKARAKARKAKAPKVVRVPLRDRLILRLASMDLRPRTLAAKVPFVVLIIGSLGLGLGITLWLSTDAAERSYQLGNMREQNRALLQQKEALERDVLTAQSAPALAEAARELGMIPTRDAAHLVQDPAGNWVVVGSPKPAEGAPPPPLNTKLPDERRTPAAAPPPAPLEVPVRVPPGGVAGLTVPGAPVPGTPQLPSGAPQLSPGTPQFPTEIPHLPAAGPILPGESSPSPIGVAPGPAVVVAPPASGGIPAGPGLIGPAVAGPAPTPPGGVR